MSSSGARFCKECGKQLDSADNLPPVEGIRAISEDPQVLIRNVDDKRATKRMESINALGDMRCVEACECLAYALKDKYPQIRVSALRALGKIGEPGYPLIVRELKSGSADVRELAAEVLGRMTNDAVSPLTGALRDRNKLVRLSAVRALDNLGTDEAVRALISGLRDPDWDVQQAAKKALIKAGPQACDSLRDACDDRDVRIKKLAAEILSNLVKTCVRCNSAFETTKRDADKVLSNKCMPELDSAARSVDLPIRVCVYCKKTFEPNSENQRFCSTSCASKGSAAESKREELVQTPPTDEGPVVVHVAEQSGAGQFDRLPRRCEYCNKFFKPNRENQRFCSASCSSKGSATGSKREELVPTPPTNERPVVGHVAEQSGAEVVVPSAQRVEPSDIPDWSYETFLFKRVAQYRGPHKEIVTSAVPFFNLLCELLNDIVIDWHTKIEISSALGYLVLADDVIPDRSEDGLIDDIFVMSYILHGINERFSSEPIKRNWHLDEDVCTMIERDIRRVQ